MGCTSVGQVCCCKVANQSRCQSSHQACFYQLAACFCCDLTMDYSKEGCVNYSGQVSSCDCARLELRCAWLELRAVRAATAQEQQQLLSLSCSSSSGCCCGRKSSTGDSSYVAASFLTDCL